MMYVSGIHTYAYIVAFALLFQNGGTPLMVASEQGHLPVVKTLLEHSATIDLKDEVWSEHSIVQVHNIPMFSVCVSSNL